MRKSILLMSLFSTPLLSFAEGEIYREHFACSEALVELSRQAFPLRSDNNLPYFARDPKTREALFEIRQLDADHVAVVSPSGLQVFDVKKDFTEKTAVYINSPKPGRIGNVIEIEEAIVQRRNIKLPDGSNYAIELPYDGVTGQYLSSAWKAGPGHEEITRADFEKELAYIEKQILVNKASIEIKRIEYQEACATGAPTSQDLISNIVDVLKGDGADDRKIAEEKFAEVRDAEKFNERLEAERTRFLTAQSKDAPRRAEVNARIPNLASVSLTAKHSEALQKELSDQISGTLSAVGKLNDPTQSIKKMDPKLKKRALDTIESCKEISTRYKIDLAAYESLLGDESSAAQPAGWGSPLPVTAPKK